MSGLFTKSGGLAADVKVTDDEFVQLRDFIYEQSGIFIAENRKYLIENRLSNRIKELKLKSFGEYYYYLRFDHCRKKELTRLFEVITTNETSFYRNPPQLKVFQDKILPATLDALRQKGQRKLRIWSAGCSTGEEPYTLAIILHEVMKTELLNWDIKITANDLSEAVLEAAKRGRYSEYALRTTPREIVDRYFVRKDAVYDIQPRLKDLVSFAPINLSDRLMLKRNERSNIIFCRNVIIYFDDDMKKQVIESFYDNLVPGGCMFIGHSESLHNISRTFKPEHHVGTIVYRKQSEPGIPSGPLGQAGSRQPEQGTQAGILGHAVPKKPEPGIPTGPLGQAGCRQPEQGTQPGILGHAVPGRLPGSGGKP